MGYSRNGRDVIVGLCTAATLLFLNGTALRADDDESLTPFDTATAQASSVAEPSQNLPTWWSGDLGTRSQLTGDWGGSRTELATNGLTFFGDITQYFQGVTTGGLARQFAYGGRGDYLIDVDSEKLGLWGGGHLDLRGETRLGQDLNRIDGVTAPSNFAMALPLPGQNVTALTGLQLTQDLSDRVTVFAGKLSLLDGTPATYERGLRLNYFWNAAMQSNLSRAYLLPSVLGCGCVVRDEVEPVFNFYLLDTRFTPTTSGFSTLFANGVVLYSEYRIRTNWFDLPGHSIFGFLYSNATRRLLDFNPSIVLPPATVEDALRPQTMAWTATYRFDQVLYADPEDTNRTWALNSDFGLTDGNPNPIHWFANASLVGTSPIRGREADTIGIGYYHLGASNLPALQQLGIGDENGVELFYNAAITPWFHVTPDLQILDPARSHIATTILVGIRGRLSF